MLLLLLLFRGDDDADDDDDPGGRVFEPFATACFSPNPSNDDFFSIPLLSLFLLVMLPIADEKLLELSEVCELSDTLVKTFNIGTCDDGDW